MPDLCTESCPAAGLHRPNEGVVSCIIHWIYCRAALGAEIWLSSQGKVCYAVIGQNVPSWSISVLVPHCPVAPYSELRSFEDSFLEVRDARNHAHSTLGSYVEHTCQKHLAGAFDLYGCHVISQLNNRRDYCINTYICIGVV